MDNDNNLTKSIISPPGDTLQEHLNFIGMKSNELAERLSLPQGKIDGLICGKEPINAELATKLEDELSIPSSFWINREKEYRQELLNSEGEV